jgi:hypothetical protein
MAIDFAALIASRKSGFRLPAPFYFDPEVYARDVGAGLGIAAAPARRAA